VRSPSPDEASGCCPACNRFTGPVPVCPYCDIPIPLPPALRLIKATAILLASAGLLALWLAASRLQPPLVRIADISPAMNYARVRVAGRVAGAPRSGRNDGSINFTVNDGSGRLRIYADTAPSPAPASGDGVAVTGSIKISAGRDPILFVHSPSHITVTGGQTEGGAPE
jgi:hypothetical protein